MSIDILKEDLKLNKIRNLLLFYGPEEYLKKYYLDSIEKAVLDENMKDMNKIVLDGKADIRKIMDNCETMPVFAEKKLVVVRNSGLFKGSGKKSEEPGGKGKNKKEDLTDYLTKLPSYTYLVFYEEEIDKRVKLSDSIKKNGMVVEFPFQKPVELVKWVMKIFKSYKKEIDQITASQLVEGSEQGMTEILNEINKLILFVGERNTITSSDVDKICIKSVKSKIFDLTDAIAERNAGKSIKLLNDMLILKEPMLKILFMITRQFRQVLEMKLLKAEGLSTDQAASKMGLTPYAAGKIGRFTGAFSVDTLKKAIEESLELDVAIKTGKINDRIAAELLIARVTKNS